MTTPRWPYSSTGSVLAMASAARRMTLKVPSRLTVMTVRNSSRSCGPFLDRMRPAQPTPAQLTTMRSGAPDSTTCATAAETSSWLVTSAGIRVTPAGTLSPARSIDAGTSRPKTVAPSSAKRLAVAAPRPLAPPVIMAAEPEISTMVLSFVTASWPFVNCTLTRAGPAPAHGTLGRYGENRGMQRKAGNARQLPRGRHGLPREQVIASQRDRILDAMADAMAAQGYVGTSVAAVLKRAGVSRETFYEQFRSKEDCFEAAHARAVERLVARIAAAADKREDAPAEGPDLERMDRLVTAYLAGLIEDPAYARLYLVEVYAVGSKALSTRAQLQVSFVNLIAEVL